MIEQQGLAIINEKTEGQQRLISSIAMTIVLISLSMLFAAFFLGFAIYRSGQEMWPPMGLPRVSWFFPFLSTCFILLSSFTFYKLEKANFDNAKKWWKITFLLGVLFMLSQLKVWFTMKDQGLETSSGIFASLLYAFTWSHAAHVIVGLFTLCFCYNVLNKPVNDLKRVLRLENIGKFWHFLTIIWFLIYFFLFVF